MGKPFGTVLLKRKGLNAMVWCGVIMLGGCTSTSTIDTAFSDLGAPAQTAHLPPPARPTALTTPVGHNQAAPGQPAGASLAPDAPAGPQDTGVFPNINDEPAPTLSAETDNAALLAQMQALAAAQANGRISPVAYQARMAELRRLAATHSSETLRQIEDQ